MNEQLLSTIIGNSAFAAMLVVVWNYGNKRDERNKEEVKILNDKVLDAFTEQTKASIEMKNVISNNTRAIEHLTERIYNVLTDKK